MRLSFQNDFSRYRQLWAFLSLCSLFALAMPQMVWACSMTGQIARNTIPTCPCVQQSSKETSGKETSEKTPVHRCCAALPLPSGSADVSGLQKNLIPVRSDGELAPDYDACADSELFLGVSSFQLKEPGSFSTAPFPFNSPRLNSQHSLRLFSGRAPPF